MGHMKDFDIRIRSGGDDAIAAVSEYVAEQEKLNAQLESMLDRCSKKLWVEWVPVAEQLPTRDQVVLVAWEGWELVTLGHFIDGDWFDPVVAISEYGPPTHWMPLPIATERQRSAASNTGAKMTDEVNEMSAASRGSHAAAWAVEHGGSIVYVAIRAHDAQEWAGSGPVDVVPLYRWPTLTDEERAVLEVCATHWQTVPASKILRGLLERLG